jgi:hypothetical protein
MQKCADASFCSRNRGRAGDVYSIKPGSAVLSGAKLAATVVNEEVEPAVELTLTLSLYDGFLRLQVDEAQPVGRYMVADVLAEGFLGMQGAQSVRMEEGKDGLTVSAGGVRVVLKYWPMQVDVFRGDTHAISFNSRQMFTFEHARQKQVSEIFHDQFSAFVLLNINSEHVVFGIGRGGVSDTLLLLASHHHKGSCTFVAQLLYPPCATYIMFINNFKTNRYLLVITNGDGRLCP